MRFKALVFVRLRGSVSDAAGNAVMNNVNRIAPKLQPQVSQLQFQEAQEGGGGDCGALEAKLDKLIEILHHKFDFEM